MIAHGLSPDLLEEVAQYRAASVGDDAWPSEQLELLADYGVFADVIPQAYEGDPVDPTRLLARYLALAEACVETAFVLTQRNGACQRIAASSNEDCKRDVLPALARGETFATVGISHLTTSRQHMAEPAMVARSDGDRWALRGEAPWVTGAAQADWIVTGGATPDGQQLLVLLSPQSNLVELGESADLLGFSSSHTASVRAAGVTIGAERVLAGPSARVLHDVKVGGTGSLTTSAVAAGAAAASIAGLTAEAQRRPELAAAAKRLQQQQRRLAEKLFGAARGETDGPGETNRLRAEANSLAVRSATAWLAAAKGSGYLARHPAQRAVREAMFFLVWSCPRSVALQAVSEYATAPTTLR